MAWLCGVFLCLVDVVSRCTRIENLPLHEMGLHVVVAITELSELAKTMLTTVVLSIIALCTYTYTIHIQQLTFRFIGNQDVFIIVCCCCCRYNGFLPQGDRGRRRSKFVLYQRSQPTGVRKSKHYVVTTPHSSEVKHAKFTSSQLFIQKSKYPYIYRRAKQPHPLPKMQPVG